MSSNINWELRIKESTWKEVKKFPLSDQSRLIEIIETLPFNPYAGDVQKMKGEKNSWRRRIGAFRIFYEIIINDKVIYVFRVERRKSKTY